MSSTYKEFVPRGAAVLSKYCNNCREHYDQHVTRTITGGGSIRACPPPSNASCRSTVQDTSSLLVTSTSPVDSAQRTGRPPAPLQAPYCTDDTPVAPRMQSWKHAMKPPDNMKGSGAQVINPYE